MKYQLKNDNYYTFSTFEKNKLPPRAYFIPFGDKKSALSVPTKEGRYSSDKVVCLSGEWDFCFFKNPKKLGEWLDTDSATFDKITVPSVWEYTGYLDPMYLTTYLPFKFAPPKIPKERRIGLFRLANNNPITFYAGNQYNSVGVYRKTFFVKSTDKDFILSFLGVSSALDLFVNGAFVGYSEGAHNTAEFSINNYVKEGQNEIVAVVHRFSTGSYLETQDMFRNSGIFRDVLLFSTEKKHIWDYHVKTGFKEGKYRLEVDVTVACGRADDTVKAEFLGVTKAAKCDKEGKAHLEFFDLSVNEWSAEVPTLYPVVVEYEGEYVCEKVGFTRIEITGDTFFFNGKKIKIFGVDHHDTHPEKGWTMSIEDMERDVKLMKEYNVNAVRTSHYPPDPLFVRLCREYGLYLIEEADIETHCAHASHNLSYISRNEKWKEHYLDRVKRMYYRDRNLCNVIMWSLGNESGGLTCQKYCYDYLKTQTDTPVHYEWCGANERVPFDVFSEMYTPIEEMKEKSEKRKGDVRYNRPYFLCEYAHSMGVGPGALEDYVELFLSQDNYLGGCIWEWADHSVYHKENGNYTYGGDHHEYIVDKTFCIDGLFKPDRTPYTSAFVMKTAYRPVRAKYLGDGKVELSCVNRFRSTEYIAISYALVVGGMRQPDKELDLTLLAQEKKVFTIDYPEGQEVFLNIKYREKGTERVIAEEQLPIVTCLAEVERGASDFAVKEDKKTVCFQNENMTVVFDKKKADIRSLIIGGKEWIAPGKKSSYGVKEELYHAPMCNDIKIGKKWKRMGLDRCKPGRVKCAVEGDKVRFSYYLTNGLFPLAKVEDEYTFIGGGMAVDTTCKTFYELLVPRIGKTFSFRGDVASTRYYGRGDKENYPDMNKHAPIGIYERKGNFGEKMIVPQSSGERTDVRWAELTLTDGTGIKIVAGGAPFGLNVNRYSERDLASWSHIVDYKDGDATYVRVDGFLRGVGSNSCGPLPELKYRIPEKTALRYSFILYPFEGKKKP